MLASLSKLTSVGTGEIDFSPSTPSMEIESTGRFRTRVTATIRSQADLTRSVACFCQPPCAFRRRGLPSWTPSIPRLHLQGHSQRSQLPSSPRNPQTTGWDGLWVVPTPHRHFPMVCRPLSVVCRLWRSRFGVSVGGEVNQASVVSCSASVTVSVKSPDPPY